MENKFSLEILKKYHAGEFNAQALMTLRQLQQRVQQKELLFSEHEANEFEKMKQLFPEEFELLENDNAYQELTEEEKRQVKKRMEDDHYRAFMNNRLGKKAA